jgi:hypothetical protein
LTLSDSYFQVSDNLHYLFFAPTPDKPGISRRICFAARKGSALTQYVQKPLTGERRQKSRRFCSLGKPAATT